MIRGLAYVLRAMIAGASSSDQSSPMSHINEIPSPIMEFIKPVFTSLSEVALLRKCLHGQTKNTNESVKNVISSRLPKTGFLGLKTLHTGVYDAIAIFNCGQLVKCLVMTNLGISPGRHRLMVQ